MNTVLLLTALGALVMAALNLMGHGTADYALMLLAIVVVVERMRIEERR